MKYTTFRALIGTGALLLGGGALALGVVQCGACDEASTQVVATAPGPSPVGAPPGGQVPGGQVPGGQVPVGVPPAGPLGTQGPAEEGPLRALDRAVMARVAQGISSEKEKDALRGQAWKVNLYKDAGKARVNRAKVDLDRDEKFDEKWTFEDDGRVKRQVAPADDENYTVELRLEGERWRLKK